MTSLPRRTINEVGAMYHLEPTLRDIYLEGPRDREFIKWFLACNNLEDVGVYDIATVEAADNASDGGNRRRVIDFAYQLERQMPGVLTHRVACIVDADTDYILGVEHNCTLLLMTDYTDRKSTRLNSSHMSI